MTLAPERDLGTPAVPAGAADPQVSLTIDGRAVTVPLGTSVMRTAAEAGVDIPRLRVGVVGLAPGTEDGIAIHAGQQVAFTGQRQPWQPQQRIRAKADLPAHRPHRPVGRLQQAQRIKGIGQHHRLGGDDHATRGVEQLPAAVAAAQ